MNQRVASGCRGCHALPARDITRTQTVARPSQQHVFLCAQQLSSRGAHPIPSKQAFFTKGGTH